MFNWINASEISFNSFLLMDRFLINAILSHHKDNDEYCKNLGIALDNNPEVAWYFKTRCPEMEMSVNQLIEGATKKVSIVEIRKAETFIIDYLDWAVVYVYPELMNEKCPYITEWDEDKLLSMTDFNNKVVLDIGSGTGRLAFAAAKLAQKVYASEPVDRLREFMRDKIRKENISNVVVIDGTVEEIPYPDNSFDIVMSGHVVGDDYARELAEITRVVKPNGYIIDCVGEDDRKCDKPKQELLDAGFEYSYYKSKTGGDVYRYIKKVIK